MRQRKGFALPLVITMIAFILLLGGLAVSVANSTHKISYGNIKKNQAFYLAKAGTEIGYGFLDSPINTGLDPGRGMTWFNVSAPSYTVKTINQVRTDLEARIRSSQTIQVYFDTSNPNAKPVFVGGGSSGVVSGTHIANIDLTITLVSADGSALTKDNAVYRIVSKATLINTVESVNNERTVRLDVRGSNKFDRKFY